jgi:hypothetical protein
LDIRDLKTGSRIRARADCYPAGTGSTGTVQYVRAALFYIVVKWDQPQENLGSEEISEVNGEDLELFDIVAE